MKLQNFKSWYTLPEAAKHLSVISNELVSEHDVLHFITEGHLKAAIILIKHPAQHVEPSGFVDAFIQDVQSPDCSERINAVCLWKLSSNQITSLDGIYNVDTRAAVITDYLRALHTERETDQCNPFRTLVVVSEDGNYFQLMVRKTKGESVDIVRGAHKTKLNVFHAGENGYDPKPIDLNVKDIVVRRLDLETFIRKNLQTEDQSAQQNTGTSSIASPLVEDESNVHGHFVGDRMEHGEKPQRGNEKIPGKMPKTSVGKLAIKAAWEIEQRQQFKATDAEVMARLQQWAKDEVEPDVLRKANIRERTVTWVTDKYKEKTYTLEACQRTLQTWNLSRR